MDTHSRNSRLSFDPFIVLFSRFIFHFVHRLLTGIYVFVYFVFEVRISRDRNNFLDFRDFYEFKLAARESETKREVN